GAAGHQVIRHEVLRARQNRRQEMDRGRRFGDPWCPRVDEEEERAGQPHHLQNVGQGIHHGYRLHARHRTTRHRSDDRARKPDVRIWPLRVVAATVAADRRTVDLKALRVLVSGMFVLSMHAAAQAATVDPAHARADVIVAWNKAAYDVAYGEDK